jgi:hypothetical protein
MIQATQTVTPSSLSVDQQNFGFLPMDGSSFYYYSSCAQIQLIGSLGFAVMKRQFWRQLHCRPPAVQLLA